MSFIDEIPYWTKEKHGKRYRLMYQACMHPKYIEYGKQFFAGGQREIYRVCKAPGSGTRDPAYGTDAAYLHPLRACVHYAMFEDDYYLESQLGAL